MSFVQLHCHSEFSALDGLSTPEEMAAAALADGQPAMAITDHGTCAGHPSFQIACEQVGIKPIFGMEAYFVEDRTKREGKSNEYWHLVLLAMNDEGLRNLWAMSTESYRDGFYYKPRIDWDTLERLNGGIIATTACLGGPVLGPANHGDFSKGASNLYRLNEIFGDRLYIEIHVNQLPEQVELNKWLMEFCADFDEGRARGIEGLPKPIAVVDAHYAHKCDAHTHGAWLAIQTDSDLADDTGMFGGGQEYHLMTEREVREALRRQGLPASFVGQCVDNTIEAADRCSAKIEKKDHNPVYSKPTQKHPDAVDHDNERLLETCLQRWEERTGGKSKPQDVYMARFEKEYALIVEKGFAGYFLMVWDQVAYAKRSGIMVGPARGSGGGSLVAYLLGIIELDPVEYDILFERFMTRGRTELPDFDVDYPSTKKQMMFDYVAERWGADHVATVGTHMRLKSKSAFQSVARAMKSQLPEDHWSDIQAISAIVDAAEADTAGLGLSWEDLWNRAGDELEPYQAKYPELFELTTKLHGRLKTYGKHPAGIIIDPESSLAVNLPLRAGDNGQMVAQFDLQVLELLGYVKFDMLNLRTLDTLQECVDSIHEQTGRWIEPYAWRDELEDPYLYQQTSDGWTLGLFQIETNTGTTMCRRFKPKSLPELADVVTLVRPGPARSGLTDLYLRRRNGEEGISYADDRMESILAKTQGCMIYQEQLMNLCMTLAGYDDIEADQVRKILGKKKVDKIKLERPRFLERAMANGTDQKVAEDLWEQMEEFAKYSFGQGHATGYALLTVWTAWFKFHYPLHFLKAALSTVKPEMIPAFVEEARRMGYQVLPPDVNESGTGFSIDSSGMAIRYGLDAVKGIGEAAVKAITEAQPYASFEDFLEHKGSKCNSGVVKTMAKVGAFDSLVPNRFGLEKLIEYNETPGVELCEHRTSTPQEIVWLPAPTRSKPDPESETWSLPCVYEWDSEPQEEGRTGKPKPRKAPPKKCTRACRHFEKIKPPRPDAFRSYTDEQIRMIEMDMLGVYLSSTPFDMIPEEDRDTFATAVEVLSGPHGSYTIAAVIKGFRTAKKRDDMGFLTLTTERGELDCVVFPRSYEQHGAQFRRGRLVYATVSKNDRGQALDLFLPID